MQPPLEDHLSLFHELIQEKKEANPPDANQADLLPPSLKTETYFLSKNPLKVPFLLRANAAEYSAITLDLSSTGLRAAVPSPMELGTPISLQCSFGDVCYLTLSGQVTSCSPAPPTTEPPKSFEIAIKFSAIRDWEQNILNSAILELRENPLLQEQSLLKISLAKDILAIEAASLALRKNRPFTDRTPISRQPCSHASKIIGWGSYLPDMEVTNQDITKMVMPPGYKNVGEVIAALTGIKSRRYATTERYPSDLATLAAREALKNAGLDPKDLDVIIFFGISRDFHEPATANVVQEKLGAKNAYVYDLANACNGFITAVDTLDSMITSGRCENGLVVTGELISPYIDWNPQTKSDFKLCMFGFTIGDSGGAAVLSRTKPGDEQGIKARWFSSDGSQWRLALAGDLAGANANDKFFRSKGKEMEDLSITVMPIGFQEITQELGWKMADIDLVIPHQIPLSILENTYHKAVGIPIEKLHWTFPKYGNLATASMPVAMCDALNTQKVRPGDKVLLAGGAAGFSAGYIGLVV